MRKVFRAVMMVLQLPLRITALPVIASGEMDDWEGDELWLPAVGTFWLFALPVLLISWIFLSAWDTITSR